VRNSEFLGDESWLSQRPLATRARHPHLKLNTSLTDNEKEMIEAALRKSGEGRVYGPSGQQQNWGISRSTLESKIRH